MQKKLKLKNYYSIPFWIPYPINESLNLNRANFGFFPDLL